MAENNLGTTPIRKLLVRMSIPMMISFFIQALYNVVDGIFVARISEDALTAVSLAFPVQQLEIAIAVGIGIGAMTVVSRLNGAGETGKANKAANVSVFLCLVSAVLFAVFGLLLVRPYFEMQTQNTEIIEMGISYTAICMVASLGNLLGVAFEKMLVGYGFTIPSMLSLASGAVTNLIFDPLLIFGIGPFPKMGIAGAAVATVLGQIVSAVLSYIFMKTKVRGLKFRLLEMLPDGFSLKNISAVAIPSIVTVGTSSVMTFGMNQILLIFSTTATAVFGIWMKVLNFAYMPVYGLNNGILPIVSFNFGAGNRERAKQTVSLGRKFALLIEIFVIVIVELFPEAILKLFNASPEMLSIGTVALRIAALSLVFGAQIVVLTSSFQGLKQNKYTVICTLCRQVVFMLPVAFVLSLFKNLDLIWISVIVTEILGFLLTLHMKKKVNRNLGQDWI